MVNRKEREMLAFRARQALRNRNTPLVDDIMTKKKFRPALPEEAEPT